MSSLEEIRENRLKKLEILNKAGIQGYPVASKQDMVLSQVIEKFDKLSKSKKTLSLVGRVMSLRSQGALVFLNFDDGTARFQALIKKDTVGDKIFSLFTETIDVGDFIELKGFLFATKRGEKTLEATEWKILAKSIRQLPEKWHGLQDMEERLRHRYLDTLMSEEVKTRFILRSKMISLIRAFYDKAGYIEVETPRLQSVPGGATARPFVTHHNALDVDFYLTIAQELYLKKLLVGGFTKVYEIGRKFRNEGIDVTHNPEFTMLESNEAYADAKGQRQFVEKLFKFLVKRLFRGSGVIHDEKILNFEQKFAIVTFYDLLKRNALIPSPESITRKDAILTAKRLNVDVDESEALEKILDNIYKKTCRPKLIQPTFIIDYPVSFNPFAKRKQDDSSLIDRFQLVIGGIEVVNAFS